MSLVEIRQIGRVAVMPTVEKVTVKGRSQSVATVVVISNNRWTDAQGKAQERATSVSWTVWGKAADNAARYLTAGSRVSVSGTLESRRYQDKSGKEYTCVIAVS
jgi:single stranded DNA-binding protein